MRNKPTDAENMLWKHLRKSQLCGMRFRRQHSFERFIVDFYRNKAKLIVELDGPIHQYQGEEDLIRQQYLESNNLKVLRFSNETVLYHIDEVIKQISTFLPHPF